jgi:PAS domain-containing protein
MLPCNVSTPAAQLNEDLVELLDGLEDPMSIASAIRDRDGRILDFRIEFVNRAAERWAGIPRESMIGLITGEILSELR